MMIEKHLKPRGINDPFVLAALEKIPREIFFPEGIKDKAYDDGAFPIGHRQTISQPFIVGLMTQSLKLSKEDRVLEIGTGSGYQAAVLSQIVKEVFTIEIIEELLFNARTIFLSRGYKNIHIKKSDGYYGWEEFAPFDAIILTAAPKKIPPHLLSQLKEGGKMIAPIGEFEQTLILYEKKNNKITESKLLPVRFVPMTGKCLD